jgi:hypothetical protein
MARGIDAGRLFDVARQHWIENSRALLSLRRQTMRMLFAVSAIAVLAAGVMAQSADVPLRPGRYAITSSLEMTGQTTQPGTSGEHCITVEDMKDPENAFSPAVYATNRKNTECRVANFSRNGNKISYDVQCARALTQVEVTLSGDTFQGSRTVRPRAGAAARSVTRIEGKRTGDCGR